jgi:hypothetical protein
MNNSQNAPDQLPAGLTLQDVKRLCWLAFQEGSGYVELDLKDEQYFFADWWKVSASFLLTVLPVTACPDYEGPADQPAGSTEMPF